MSERVEALQEIIERNQVWPVMAAKWGVENPVPRWLSRITSPAARISSNITLYWSMRYMPMPDPPGPPLPPLRCDELPFEPK